MYEFVSRITGEDISKNAGALRIVRRLEQDQKAGGPTAQDMIDLLNETPEKPQNVMDVGGENVRALGGNVARAPGPGRQTMTSALNERDMGAGTRLAGDVNAGIGEGSACDRGHNARAVTLDGERHHDDITTRRSTRTK